MLRVTILLIILTLACKLSAQELLANGTFDDINTCTEFGASCASEAWFFIPEYTVPPQREGTNRFEVISMGSLSGLPSQNRNYLYSKILCPLKANSNYQLGIWINTDNNYFDHLDVWLNQYEPGGNSQTIHITAPTFRLTSANKISSKSKWTEYSYVYTATGGEQFIMIGNLSDYWIDKSNIDRITKNNNVQYKIDNISLMPVDTSEKMCNQHTAILKQLYDQNRRHSKFFVEDMPLDKSLLKNDNGNSKKIIDLVLIDTPPSLQKPIFDTISLPDVLFLPNSSILDPSFISHIENKIKILEKSFFIGLEIIGHTDNKGNSSYNLWLSLERAKSVKDYLTRFFNLKAENIMVKGLGDSQPKATNGTVEGRQKNRRVEIIFKR